MAQNVFPVDAVSGAPSYTGQVARTALGALLGGKSTVRPLGARSGATAGIRRNSILSVTSTTWSVSPFSGVIDVATTVTNGPYMYAFDSTTTGSINAAPSVGNRYDRLDVQIDDPATSDGSSVPAMRIVYTAGVASTGTPAFPALAARSHALALIYVPQSGTGSPTIGFIGPHSVAAGGVLPCGSSTDYPSDPYPGQVIYDLTLMTQQCYNGSAWEEPPPNNLAHQQLSFYPSGNADSSTGAAATWVSLGTTVVPGWATKCRYTLVGNSLLGLSAPATFGELTVALQIGTAVAANASSWSFSTVSQRASMTAIQVVNAPPVGSQTVTVQATHVLGNSMRSDSLTSWELALDYLPS